MAIPSSDEPESISQEEARQELFGRGPSTVGMEVYEVVAIVLGIVGAAIAVEEIDSWAQWVVLAGIVAMVLGLIIALNPNRRE
jgi:hypothetical protein